MREKYKTIATFVRVCWYYQEGADPVRQLHTARAIIWEKEQVSLRGNASDLYANSAQFDSWLDSRLPCSVTEACLRYLYVNAGYYRKLHNKHFFQNSFQTINLLTLNDPYRGRTAPLTYKRCILYIYSTNIGTEYFKRGIYSPFFPLQNAVCFTILTYLVPVLFTFYLQGVLKLKK